MYILFLFTGIFMVSCLNGQQGEDGLKDLFRDHFLIGAAINGGQVEGTDTSSLEVILKEFNTITSENSMKPRHTQPANGKFTFEMADKFVEFGEKNDMFIIGHCLIWHNQTPPWMFQDENGKPVSRDTLLMRMQKHIHTLVGRYKGRVNGWDVLNEVVADDGSMRKTPYYEIIGEEYILKAFEYAREADPEAELYYNDYSLATPAKREGVIRLIRDLQAKGAKIDGIGMQAHYDLHYPELKEFEKSILQFYELGVQVMITEMDISALPSPYNYTGAEISQNFELKEKLNPYKDFLPDSVQAEHARRYAGFFEVMLRNSDKISRVTFWGVNDKQSWKNNFPVRGRTDYPLIFDRENKPKPAYFAIRELIEKKK